MSWPGWGLPVIALLLLATVTRPDAILIAAAALGLVLLVSPWRRSSACCCSDGHSRSACAHDPPARGRRPATAAGAAASRRGSVTRSLLAFRDRASALLTARSWRISATTASHLALWLVLLACLRDVGLTQAQVPWQTSWPPSPSSGC